MNLRLNNVRFSYLNVYTPREQENEKGEVETKFSASLILEPGSPDHKAVQDTIRTVAKDKWGDRAETVLKILETSDRVCLKDGNKRLDKKTGEVSPGYEGKVFITASLRSETKDGVPQTVRVFNRFGQKITAETKGLFTGEQRGPVSGDIGQALIDLWAYDDSDPKKGKRIIATLKGVSVSTFGQPFGRREETDEDIAAQFTFAEPVGIMEE